MIAAATDRRDRVVVTGSDTWTFLQSLLSQDVDGMAEGERRATLLLTPQGKVDVFAGLTRRGDDAVLDTDPGWGERLAASLNRFKIRTKVALTVEPASPVDDRTAASEEAARIRAGVPRLGADLDDSVIPQEALLEQDAVSFTKGCFIGQELVCRIDSRGHVNRFLRHLVPDDPTVVLPVGADLVVDGKVVGAVTSSAPGIALGFVRREVVPPATVTGGNVGIRVAEIGSAPVA
jgi:folate-binding protein YgfZ